MKRGVLWRISVATTAEAEDVVVDLFSSVLGNPATSYTGAETRTATVAVFCERRPPGMKAKCAALRAGLKRIESCGLDVGAGRVRIQTISREDWAESWKRHFKPIEIGEALLIKPSWSKRRARAGQAVVVLDPGLSFGTGQHPTTEFCLRELVSDRGCGQRPSRSVTKCSKQIANFKAQITQRELRLVLRTQPRSFLDIGTGSGILAIAAAKLGYAPVCALDFDPEAVRVALSNARTNGVNSKIRITRADVTKLSGRLRGSYDVVCANLISTLLIAERRTIAALVKPGGLLVLAGILKSEFHEVQAAYESLGLRLVASKSEKEWRSGSFRFARHFNSRNET
jgi:ribosomal protein L11 methyltransferase